MKLFCLSFILSSQLIAAPVPSKIKMVAYLDQTPIWNIVLEVKNPKRCQVVGSISGKSKLSEKPISEEDCAELSKITELVFRESEKIDSKKKLKIKMEAMDEPSYAFHIESKVFQVFFEAPGTCDTKPSGEMNCHKNTLSAAQELLIYLRGQAQDMGFVGGHR